MKGLHKTFFRHILQQYGECLVGLSCLSICKNAGLKEQILIKFHILTNNIYTIFSLHNFYYNNEHKILKHKKKMLIH
jgi:hypothetical protein